MTGRLALPRLRISTRVLSWAACGLRLAVLAGALPCAAAPIDDARALAGTDWYSVSLMGRPAGYAYTKAEVLEGGDAGPQLRATQFVHAQFQLQGFSTVLTLEFELTQTFDADLQPISFSSKSNELGRARETEARVTEQGLEVLVKAGGREMRKTLPLPPGGLGSDFPLIMSIVRGQAKVGDRLEFDMFEPMTAELEHQVMVVSEVKPLADGRRAYVLQSKGTRIPVEETSLVASDGTLLSMVTAAPLNLALQLTTREKALEAFKPFVLSASIPCSVRIENPRRLETLKIRATGGEPPASDIIPPTRRQRVEPEGNSVVVTIRRVANTASAPNLPITGEQFAPYLRSTELGQTDDPAILAKAREIVGDERDARRAAERIVHWVYANLRKVASEPRPISAREVLEQMGGDCSEHAVLCAALCAAAGIPAKLCTGLAYAAGAFYYHAWNEVYVGEWVEMDPSWDELAVDAGHIQLASSSLDAADFLKAILAVGKSFGSLKIEVLEHTLAEE